jgi:endonuclease YncB( thermonuclease family)
MSIILAILGSSTGRTCVVLVVAFLAGFVVCWRWTHRAVRHTTETVQVIEATNGATLEAKAGLLERRTRKISLAAIAAPGLDEPLGQQSKENLAKLAGSTVRVESVFGRLDRGDAVGICYGERGDNLNLAQLRAGLARCESSAPADFKAAQKEAQKAKRGIWGA